MPFTLTAPALKTKALELGFDACGIARAERHPKLARLADWLDEGLAGDMHYLRDSLDERLDVRAVLPTARSVISLATVYNTAQPYSHHALAPGRAAIARYAWGRDYHDEIRGRLRQLLAWMAGEAGPGLEAFSCVDDGPVQERVFAAAAASSQGRGEAEEGGACRRAATGGDPAGGADRRRSRRCAAGAGGTGGGDWVEPVGDVEAGQERGVQSRREMDRGAVRQPCQ